MLKSITFKALRGRGNRPKKIISLNHYGKNIIISPPIAIQKDEIVVEEKETFYIGSKLHDFYREIGTYIQTNNKFSHFIGKRVLV